MKRLFKLARFFTEENPFKDSTGRFIDRWSTKQNPSVSIPLQNEIPMYRVPFHKVDKKRIFDFDLPKEFQAAGTPLSIWSLTDSMFSVNQIWIQGPILIFPEAVFQWHASRVEDIEDHHLDIIKVIEPRIEYAIIGTGKATSFNSSESLRQRFRMIGINVDFCPTVKNI